jgi:hypothetical protein
LLPVFFCSWCIPIELLADASPVAAVPGAPPAQQSRPKPFPTRLAGQASSQIPIHGVGLIAQADGRDSMADRARTSEHHGLCLGLNATKLQRLRLPATPLCRKSWNGSPGS